MLQRQPICFLGRGVPLLTAACSRLDAWHVVNNTDPLEDSDTEADEHVRLDYSEDAVRAQANYQFIYSLPRRR